MDRGKLVSAALFLAVLGALLILPPLVVLFQLEVRVLGLPADVIYLFVCWGALILATFLLSRRLPHEPEDGSSQP